MSDTFLTSEEIRQLTGCARKAQQIATLKKNRIPYYLNAAGRPIVVRKSIEGFKSNMNVATPSKGWEPKVMSKAA